MAPLTALGRRVAGVALLVAAGAATAALSAGPEPASGDGDSAARRLAEQALALEHGEGVPKDPLQAAALYCEAARLGHGEAMYALGWMYANGRGVPREDAYAATLFEMAIAKGHEGAAQARRFVGDYTGAAPDCLRERSPEQWLADERWDPQQYLASQPAERRRLAELVAHLAPRFAIDPRLALAIATTESNFDPNAKSPKNAAGVMQLIPETASRFNVKNSFDPVQNIQGGLAYLRWLLAYYRGNVPLAVAGYNAGEGAVDRYRGVPPYEETRNYVRRILKFFPRTEHPFDARVVAPSPVLQSLRIATP